MKATHIIFIAWEKADEKENQAINWANFGNSNRSQKGDNSKGEHRLYKVVVYKKNTWDTDLMHMSTGQIYVLGHGAKGYGSIADLDGNGGTELKAEEVADRLRGSGLSDTYRGKVNCFNCNSAKSDGNELSFATRFANRLREKGHSHCQIFGYNSAVESAYEERGFGGAHKHSLSDQEFVDGTLIHDYAPQGRAKDFKAAV